MTDFALLCTAAGFLTLWSGILAFGTDSSPVHVPAE